MARDYGRKGTNSRHKSSAPRQFLWIIASFLSGYLAATVFDVTSLSNWINKNVLAEQEKTAAPAPAVVKHDERPKPKFEFYTLLSKDNSAPVINHSSTTAPAAAKPMTGPGTTPTQTAAGQSVGQAAVHAGQPAVAVVESKPVLDAKPAAPMAQAHESYLVQVAAFNRRQDAERLKALLVLKGFDVSITTVVQNRTNWFRVIIGPFHSRSEAEKAQTDVARTERIKGIIRKFNV
ncbi:SPOR domain-containing protein [Legionella taurinensis]|uniref:Cell division protein FtsN n=1 Tax=Legionella taurinensis TaxID=70611 RepID=A0A3A5LIT5_9GAMM|nr:SPOR domain-containing protein [Legionella taurinensis]MDX1836392.1 SPOR domain-containing protein [Legionella taurinensis]PUT43136.1 cell division protein FtsN [Legionella taurinensis]PUT45047.1 cell division protein FtsN [Legionella taurinensis]PUT45691.1 cell division protein FtsN [Legionella taurinensis]PUT49460.1 cell division protein FtsN [Legionella taurinensis]